jgi:hypothetical protein
MQNPVRLTIASELREARRNATEALAYHEKLGHGRWVRKRNKWARMLATNSLYTFHGIEWGDSSERL